jgi:hypothetical protein
LSDVLDYESYVLRSRRGGINEAESKLDMEELPDLYNLSYIFRIPKSRIMKWAGHVRLREEKKMHTEFCW